MYKKNIVFPLFIVVLGCISKSSQNLEDMKKIKKGMSYNKVQSIMTNQPIMFDMIINYKNDSMLVEGYESHFAASDSYLIFYNVKDSTVVKLDFGH
jgi:hypothetical protein